MGLMNNDTVDSLRRVDEICTEALKDINLFPPGDDLVRRVEALASAAKAFKEEWEAKVRSDAQTAIDANLGVFGEIRGMVERAIGREVPAGISPAEAVGLLVAELDEARAALAQACKVIDDRGICERDAGAPLPGRLDRIIVDLQTGLDDAENHVGQLRWFAVQIMAERDAARAEVERLNAEMALIVRIMVGPPEAVAAEVEAMEPGKTRAAWLAIEIANKHANAIAKARANRELRAEVYRLKAAVQDHHDQAGDDWPLHLDVEQAKRVRDALDSFITENASHV